MDGHAAAWVVGHACGFENVEFVPIGYNAELPDFKGREVYMVDIALDPTFELMHQISRAKKVVILDHHDTAYAKWQNVKLAEPHMYRYMPERSGVGVTWCWFFGALLEMPQALQLVQDRDLWQFQMYGTKEFHEVALSHGLLDTVPAQEDWLGRMVNYEIGLAGDLTEVLKESIMAEGQAILRSKKQTLQMLLKRARVVNFMGYEVPLCQVPYDLRSEAGFWLSLKYPFSITYDDNWATGERRYSVRSNKKTGISVLPIGEAHGGGGHKHAVGWTRDVATDDFCYVTLNNQLKLDLEIQ
jgi:oligoribonuclease NrnB/cAMP/cGMP phosphodiesterase (DHH superfamily)